MEERILFPWEKPMQQSTGYVQVGNVASLFQSKSLGGFYTAIIYAPHEAILRRSN